MTELTKSIKAYVNAVKKDVEETDNQSKKFVANRYYIDAIEMLDNCNTKAQEKEVRSLMEYLKGVARYDRI